MGMTEREQRESRQLIETPHMPDAPSNAGAVRNIEGEAERSSSYQTPRWVKVFGIVFIVVLVLLVLIQHLVFSGMGGHMR